MPRPAELPALERRACPRERPSRPPWIALPCTASRERRVGFNSFGPQGLRDQWPEAGGTEVPPRERASNGGSVMRSWWMTMVDGGNPQDDSDSGNKHGGGGSDEGGNTSDGSQPTDGE